MRAVLCALAALVVGAPSAEARELRPGQYRIGAVHEICVRPSGDWRGLTMENWTGRWQYRPEVNTTFLFGNFLEGSGNNVIQVRGRLANWIEWNDEMTFEILRTALPVVRVKRRCDRDTWTPWTAAQGGAAP